MPLILPPWYFASESSNANSTPQSTLIGTGFTAGTLNADGTPVSVLSALAFDAVGLWIGWGGIRANLSAVTGLLDILVDPAGGTSWSDLASDLVAGYGHPPDNQQGGYFTHQYFFPIYIKAGTSIGVQCRTPYTVGVSGRVMIRVYGNPSRPDRWWCGSKIESLGIDAANSKGTTVSPGNATWGTWTSVGSTTGARYGALQFGVNGSDSSMLARAYHWEVGYGSNKVPGSPTFFCVGNTSESLGRASFGVPIWCDIPSGTQMQARGICNSSPEDFDVGIYGVY